MTKPPEMRDSLWNQIAKQRLNERVLRLMAWLSDEVKPREEWGANRGAWVKKFLASVGLDMGFPWCAAALSWCVVHAGGTLPRRPASVKGWHDWAKESGRLRTAPKRGYLCYWLNPDGTGHIGAVVIAKFGLVYSLEGNTGPGEAGNQRDGDGFYRRIRKARAWDGYISLEEDA